MTGISLISHRGSSTRESFCSGFLTPTVHYRRKQRHGSFDRVPKKRVITWRLPLAQYSETIKTSGNSAHIPTYGLRFTCRISHACSRKNNNKISPSYKTTRTKTLGSFEEKFFKKRFLKFASLYSSLTSYIIYARFMDCEDVICS